MRTYLLFLFGVFEDHGDIEFFCLEILGQAESINSVRYVIENNQNVIGIFDSNVDHGKLSEEIHGLTKNDSIKFYFLFEKNSLVSVFLPDTVNDFVFKPSSMDPLMMKIQYTKYSDEPEIFDLDSILEKIEEYGVESLTPLEKKFLDNFAK